MGIGENIKRFRQAFNMEQKDLADKLHISDKTVSSWECGRTEPKMGMSEDIAEAFGITKTDLIEGKIYQSFDTPNDFLRKWRELGGGKTPLDLTDEEYDLILDIRSVSDDKFIKRMRAYIEALKGVDNGNS